MLSTFSHLTFAILTLGCKVNQYESEAIAEAMTEAGFVLQPSHKACDLYIINTCTVTAESDRKARSSDDVRRDVLVCAEIPASYERSRKRKRNYAKEKSGDDGIYKKSPVACILRRKLDRHRLHAERGKRHGIRNAECDIVDGEHVLRFDSPSDEGGDCDRRKHQQETSERKRKREPKLFEGKAGNARKRLRFFGPGLVWKTRDVRTGKEPCRDKLHGDTEGKRRKSPPRPHKTHPRECDGEGKCHNKADERRIVRLRTFEVIEEDNHRDIADKE